MANKKYDLELLKFFSFFEKITHVAAKDCLVDASGALVFVVPEEKISKAVGKQGANAKKLHTAMNRKIKILAFNPDLKSFVKNVVHPIKVADINEEDGVVTIKSQDHASRGLLIGRNAQNLRNFESIVKRFFEIKEIKVI